MQKDGGRDRRRYIRLKSIYPVEFYLLDSVGVQISGLKQGFTHNISVHGLCVDINNFSAEDLQFLADGSIRSALRIRIPLRGTPVCAVGRVSWLERLGLPYPQSYRLGIQYESIGLAEQRALIWHARWRQAAPWIYATIVFLLVAAVCLMRWQRVALEHRNAELIARVRSTAAGYSRLYEQFDQAQKQAEYTRQKLSEQLEKVTRANEDLNELYRNEQAQILLQNNSVVAQLRRQIAAQEQLIAELSHKRDDLQRTFRRQDAQLEQLDRSISTQRGLDRDIVRQGTEPMYRWLRQSQNSRTGLVLSYDRDIQLEDVGFTYDQALSVMAFVCRGDYERAERILTFYQRKAPRLHGGIATAYDVKNGRIAEYTLSSGPPVYLALAALHWEERTHSRNFEGLIHEIADWVTALIREHGGNAVPGGPDMDWRSTEQNLAAYAFFSALARRDGTEQYAATAGKIKEWLGSVAYNRQLERFNRGEDDNMIATDVMALAILALGPDQLQQMHILPEGLVRCVEENCRCRIKQSIPTGADFRITGFDFCAPSSVGRKGTISVEWTAQMIVALQELSEYYAQNQQLRTARDYRRKAAYYLAELQKFVQVKPGGIAGLPYAADSHIETGHGWLTPDRTAISAAGTIFAIFAGEQYNMFQL